MINTRLYPEFTYDPSGQTMAQFWELSNLYGWDRDSDERADALAKMRDAIAQQFNAFYGSDADSLDGWYNLFQALQVQDIPDTVKGCKDLIRTIHVNICDLVDYSLGEEDDPPELHVSQEALAEYSRREGKIYPRKDAYAEGLLGFLLREITGTYQDDTDDRLSRARSETLASDFSIDDDGVSDSVFRSTSPPLPPANFSFVASSTYIPPSTSELLNRVREAKRSGKSMDEVIHELQNEFYPLLPPPGYVIPSPSLYRATVAKLERLERCGGLLNSLKRELEDEESEDSSGTEDDLNAELEYVDVVAPVPFTKKNVGSGERDSQNSMAMKKTIGLKGA
ncbi:autophagic vacuole formation-like [Lentinula edodes]|uniref:Autophagic vacuole formation-like n=1 Tax=Lentinula edodes TaxID=5353 RepID=A0A1Q3EK52_LENED|nr:autophagic vacuole formation-like [Lentinula edodes]